MVAVRPSTAPRTWSAHMEKTGDIYLASEKGGCVAYSRPADGSPERFLCAADADACGKHPGLRELLIELAAEVALNRGRAAGDSVALRVRTPLAAQRAAPELPGRVRRGSSRIEKSLA